MCYKRKAQDGMRASEGFLIQSGCSGKSSMRIQHFKFEIWVKVGFIDEKSGLCGQRTHVQNLINLYLICAFHVTMPFQKCSRGWHSQRWEIVSASEVGRLNLALSFRMHGSICL